MPSVSASFSAYWTGSFGVLMPMRSVVTSGFGSSPDGAVAVAPVDGWTVGDGVAPRPHAAATSAAAAIGRASARRNRLLIGSTPPKMPLSEHDQMYASQAERSTICPILDALRGRGRTADRVRRPWIGRAPLAHRGHWLPGRDMAG